MLSVAATKIKNPDLKEQLKDIYQEIQGFDTNVPKLNWD
jgi:hypothetical protein